MTQSETLEGRGRPSKRSPGSGPRQFLDRRACRLSNCALSSCSLRIVCAELPGLCPGTLEQAPRSSHLAQSSLVLPPSLMKARLPKIRRREKRPADETSASLKPTSLNLKRQFNVVPGTCVGSHTRNGLLRATSIVCAPWWRPPFIRVALSSRILLPLIRHLSLRISSQKGNALVRSHQQASRLKTVSP